MSASNRPPVAADLYVFFIPDSEHQTDAVAEAPFRIYPSRKGAAVKF